MATEIPSKIWKRKLRSWLESYVNLNPLIEVLITVARNSMKLERPLWDLHSRLEDVFHGKTNGS
jgi:hypothetical protein